VIIALETSAAVGGVALIESGHVLAERVLGPDTQFARDVLPALDELLEQTSRSLEQCELIALSVGPGSFTGLRIGLATALGLCFGTARRIVPVPTLAALALRADGEVRVPMLDARKRQVYAGVYASDGSSLLPDRASDPLQFLRSLDAFPQLTFLGSGASLYRDDIERALGDRARLQVGDGEGWPSARSVGLLGERLARAGHASAPHEVELRYLRASQAELEGPAAPLDTHGRNA